MNTVIYNISKYFLSYSILLIQLSAVFAESPRVLIDKGWKEFVKDNDTIAFGYFNRAYDQAIAENDSAYMAASLLHLGICTYSVSYSQGFAYAMEAINLYKHLEQANPETALEGRSRCLQLISTIKNRQGKYKEAITLSQEALAGFKLHKDTGGYLGLIYTSLGFAFKNLNQSDSSAYYYRMALEAWLKTQSFVYLPTGYLNIAQMELADGNNEKSRYYFDRAFFIADSMGNRQAKVSSLLGSGEWYLAVDGNEANAEKEFSKAKEIAIQLTDKSFYLKTLSHLMLLSKKQQKFKEALELQEEIQLLGDTLNTWDKQRALRILEMQFGIAEKDRQLKLARKEFEVVRLTNFLLWGTIGFLFIISIGIIAFLRRINKRDKALMQTKEALEIAKEEQRKLKEQQLRNELEFKESQLSAMTIQMVKKNELMQELKEGIESDTGISGHHALNQIINKGQNLDKDWQDFNAHFESINKNFYTRLKQSYPEISPNDLKMCALIKMNLSIKEMAGVLNISPDSVKTARYRLRKKLQLNTEDNLTDFILNL